MPVSLEPRPSAQFFSQPWKKSPFFHGCEKNCAEGLGSRLNASRVNRITVVMTYFISRLVIKCETARAAGLACSVVSNLVA